MNVALVTMPWGQPVQPNLLMGNLHSILEGPISVTSFSLHLEFLNHIASHGMNLKSYQSIIGCYGLGDFVFAVPPLKIIDKQEDESYCAYLRKQEVNEKTIETAINMRKSVPEFLRACIEAIDIRSREAIVFCPMYRELVPSLILAKLIKQSHPKTRVIFAGEVCEGEIGKALESCFDFVDSVFPCDPERTIKNELLSAGASQKAVAYKRTNDDKDRPRDLANLKTPNYDEYYESLDSSKFKDWIKYENWIPYETSRGCWWAEKSKCAFCALTKTNSQFRKKDIDLALDGLTHLSRKHGVLKFQFFDWIISRDYFDGLFKRISDLNYDFTIYLQSKVNLTKDNILMLKRIGAVVQFGVESLNTNTLKHINKGATAIQNIRILKWCAELDVRAEWNLLYGLPGEEKDSFARLDDLIPSLYHLWPPSFNRFRLQRLSPYFQNADTYQVDILGPIDWYNYVYSFISEENRARIAEEFTCATVSDDIRDQAVSNVKTKISNWRDSSRLVYQKLKYFRGPDFITIVDLRYQNGRREYQLDRIEALIYLACDEGITIQKIQSELLSKHGIQVRQEEVEQFLNKMLKSRLMYTENGKYLSLALAENGALT